MNFSWAVSPSVQWDIFACLEAAYDLIWGGSGPTLVNTVMIVIKGFHVSIHEWSKVYILNDFCALTNACFAKLCAWRSVNWALSSFHTAKKNSFDAPVWKYQGFYQKNYWEGLC